jgi:uncharacterized membrane protein YdjX (TVP38/TMEM64 family)
VRPHVTPRRAVVGLTLLALAGAVLALFRYTGANVNAAMIRAALQGLGLWGPLALIVALAAVLVVPLIPASLFQIGAGLAFGPWLGLLYATIADILGASAGFWLARRWGKSALERHLSPAAHDKLSALTQRMNWHSVVLLRLIPGPAYPLVSLAAGHSKLSYLRFISASLTGVLPALALLVFAGDLVASSPLLAFALVVLLVGSLALAGRLLTGRTSLQEE